MSYQSWSVAFSVAFTNLANSSFILWIYTSLLSIRFHISKDAYRVVQLDLTPQIEVFCMLFDITYEFHSSISKMAYRILPLSAENPVGPPCTFFRWTLYSDTVLWCLLPNASQQDHIMFDNLNTSEKSTDSGPWRKLFLASSPSSSARSHTSSGSFRIKN